MSVALSYGNNIICFGNVAISAGVVSPIYNVSLIQDAHGTIAASPMSGHPNQTVTLSNTPATHYHFDSYSVSGATLTGNQFKLVDQDVTAKGTFVEDDKYNLTLQTNGYGTISASKTTGYAGDTVTLSNTPSADCTFASYAATGATINGSTLTFGSQAATAKANFNRNTHSVTTQTNGYGSLVASPTTGYSGTQVTLTTAASAGYQFSGYGITGASLTGNKFNIGTSNVTVKAFYEEIPLPYPSDMHFIYVANDFDGSKIPNAVTGSDMGSYNESGTLTKNGTGANCYLSNASSSSNFLYIDLTTAQLNKMKATNGTYTFFIRVMSPTSEFMSGIICWRKDDGTGHNYMIRGQEGYLQLHTNGGNTLGSSFLLSGTDTVFKVVVTSNGIYAKNLKTNVTSNTYSKDNSELTMTSRMRTFNAGDYYELSRFYGIAGIARATTSDEDTKIANYLLNQGG